MAVRLHRVRGVVSCDAMSVQPALTRRRQELFFVFLDQLGQSVDCRIFVLGGPQDHFGEDGCQIDSFGGKRVN